MCSVPCFLVIYESLERLPISYSGSIEISGALMTLEPNAAHKGRRYSKSRALLTLAMLLAGCVAPASEAPTVAGAWQSRGDLPANQSSNRNEVFSVEPNGAVIYKQNEGEPAAKSRPAQRGGAASAQPNPIATVNGRVVARERMVDLLLRARGAEVLEQLIVLEAAEGLAAQRGITVSESDVEAEYDRALRELSQSSHTGSLIDRPAAEAVLASVLAQRHVSHEEFMLGMRRNGLLRKLANEEQVVTDAQVRAEFARRYGPRVRVAIAAVPTMADAPLWRQRLITPGQEPSGIEYLGPFSSEHDDVPAIIRQTAFGLAPGQVSDTLRLENGWVLLRVDEQVPANSEVAFESVQGELEEAVQERLCKKAMAALYERLFRESQVKINHPILREEFERAYPQR